MGYTTNFEGQLKLSRPLTIQELNEFNKFPEKPRWGRDPEFPTAPESYCQWVISDDGEHLVWDEVEKFYEYVVWIEWLIKNFFEPKGIKLNGEIEWDGEEQGDVGKIIVKDNIVTVKEGKIVYE